MQFQVLAPELYLQEYLKSGKRIDKRKANEARNLKATINCLDDCRSSSMVSLGQTILVTKINAEPQPIAPSFEITVTQSAVSNEKGKTSEDKALEMTLTSIFSRLLDLNKFEIARPDPNQLFQSAVKIWGWKLSIQISIISDDGGIKVAAFAGIEQALSSLQLPIFELQENSLVRTERNMSVETLGVSGVNFALIQDMLYVDPTIDEEKIAQGTCTILLSHEQPPNIVNIQSNGYFPMNSERFSQIFNIAKFISE